MAGFRETTRLLVQKELGPEANAKRLQQVARDGLAKLQADGTASKNFETIVDGREGQIEQAQKSITFKFSYMAEAIAFAIEFLKQRASPSRKTGKFELSWWVSIDGKFYTLPELADAKIPPFAEVVIGNTQPQNRRIDVGLDGTKKLKFRAPPGLYDDCARAMNRRFGNIVKAKRAYDYAFPSKYTPKRSGYRFQSPVVIIKPLS